MIASDIALGFFQAWNNRSLNGIIEFLSEDCIYHNMPMEPINGRSEIEAYIAPVIDTTLSIEWTVLAIAEDAKGRILNERLDRLKFSQGWLEIPIMGLLEFSEGRISLWRDYFDLQNYQQQKINLGLGS
jgi:limonene-1,2-epoxide hydrolase|tara:strand:+ start:115 stop:501 length:387 start_codon:yes stop_codon:yes gene_type:complete